jgi:molybdenum ABC transporter molybdate-binding protein
LFVYCAAGVKPPVEAVARDYEREFGVTVQLQFGGSESLLGQAEITKTGDLYLPADDSYIDLARGKNLIDETMPVALMQAVVGVRKGNPKNVRTLADLGRADMRLSLADPDAAAIGKLVRNRLRGLGTWDVASRRVIVTKPTVNDVANDIKLGTVDAGFVWDANVRLMPDDLDMVVPRELDGVKAKVTVSVLKSSKQPTAALHFARYLTARNRGLLQFEKQGYKAAEGDEWTDHPELRLFSGAMLQPAIEETIAEFEQREGAQVTRVYNGCGILVSQMRTGSVPDAYFACDPSFMTQVGDLFQDPLVISKNRMVLLVARGNPLGVHELEDLAALKVRIGVGNEQQSALGVLTRDVLKAAGLYDQVMKNVTVQSPTGDYLVNQTRAGALDVAIVYASNAALVKDQLDSVPLNVPGSVATQPFAVGKESKYKHLAGRLLETIRARASRERFEAVGFQWADGRQ